MIKNDLKVNEVLSTLKSQANKESSGGTTELTGTFKDVLDNALDTVNNLQSMADKMTQKLATGEVKDLHEVMIAVEQVNLAMQLTVQIRNKVVEAYQEVMRMQI